MERLTEEVARAERTGSCFSVVFLDVDDLKKVNDTLGHPAGDDLLKGVAAAVWHSVRRSDVVARYGGDEFIVLLCETGPEDAAAAVRRILDEVSNVQVGNFHAEVSAGVASYPADSTDPKVLVATADKRMYKEKGKKKEAQGI
jgi:diguanylate cyclase (GGDEF)-like protein